MTDPSDDRTVVCAWCEHAVPDDEIEEHHMEKHPGKRYDPVWYMQPGDSSEGPDDFDWVDVSDFAEGSDDTGEVRYEEQRPESSDPSDDSTGMKHFTATPENARHPSGPSARINAGNRTLADLFGHPITINEFHAVILGAVLGPATAIVAGTVGMTAALGAASVLVGYSILGRPVLRSLPHDRSEHPRTMALRTIRYEPWWFTSIYVVTAVLISVI